MKGSEKRSVYLLGCTRSSKITSPCLPELPIGTAQRVPFLASLEDYLGSTTASKTREAGDSKNSTLSFSRHTL